MKYDTSIAMIKTSPMPTEVLEVIATNCDPVPYHITWWWCGAGTST